MKNIDKVYQELINLGFYHDNPHNEDDFILSIHQASSGIIMEANSSRFFNFKKLVAHLEKKLSSPQVIGEDELIFSNSKNFSTITVYKENKIPKIYFKR